MNTILSTMSMITEHDEHDPEHDEHDPSKKEPEASKMFYETSGLNCLHQEYFDLRIRNE